MSWIYTLAAQQPSTASEIGKKLSLLSFINEAECLSDVRAKINIVTFGHANKWNGAKRNKQDYGVGGDSVFITTVGS